MLRCKGCSAPLPAKSRICQYCGARNEIDLKGVHAYTVVKPRSDRPCPLCEIPMETIDLQVEGKFYIERCGKCMSLFFDPNELEALLDKTVSNVFQVDFRRLHEMTKEHGGPSKVRYYKCPVCAKIMNRINFGTRSGVIVDRCEEHGVWLEGGELRRLLDWKKAGGEILDTRRREERRREDDDRKKKAREHIRRMGASGTEFDTGEGSGQGGFSHWENESDFAETVIKLISRLFR